MKKEDLKNLCMDFGMDYQRNLSNEEACDSDISIVTCNKEEDNSIDTSVTNISSNNSITCD